jgi:hypothetical protein
MTTAPRGTLHNGLQRLTALRSKGIWKTSVSFTSCCLIKKLVQHLFVSPYFLKLMLCAALRQ